MRAGYDNLARISQPDAAVFESGQLRARMGDEHADRTYAEGMALSLNQALDLAIGTAHTA